MSEARGALAPWLARLERPGAWLAVVIVAGALLRVYLLVATDGTTDVRLWAEHAERIDRDGLEAWYEIGRRSNHPPPIAWAFSVLFSFAESTGVSFRSLLRLPFALADALSAVLLFRLLRKHPHRHALTAVYWLHPLAAVFSAYHGNTDSAIACLLLAAVLCVGSGRGLAGGALIGLSVWIKLPGALAAPALLFALPHWPQRIRFVGGAAVVALLGYAPALLQDAELVVTRVLLYAGQNIQTTSGIQVWGIQNFHPDPMSLPFVLRRPFRALVEGMYRWNTVICLVPMLLVSWWQRDRSGADGLARTVAEVYVIFYGLTNFWSFQYLAWSLPFWFFLDRRLAVAANLTGSAYVLVLYAWVCGSVVLLGPWDFVGHPEWPVWLRLLRDAAILTFFVGAWWVIAAAARAAWRRQREPVPGAS